MLLIITNHLKNKSLEENREHSWRLTKKILFNLEKLSYKCLICSAAHGIRQHVLGVASRSSCISASAFTYLTSNNYINWYSVI